MKHRTSNYKELVIKLKEHKYTIKQLKERNKLLSIDVGEERAVSKRAALLRSEIKQLKEANEFKRIQIERNKKDFMIVATIMSCALIWSIAALLILL